MSTGYIHASELLPVMTGYERDGFPLDILAVEFDKTLVVATVKAQGCMVQRDPSQQKFRARTKVLVTIPEHMPVPKSFRSL